MKNKRGFSTIEILIVVAVFSVVYIGAAMNVSHAFDIDIIQEEYNQKINLIEIQAEAYAANNLSLFFESEEIYIYVKDLIDANYLIGDENGLIINPLEPNKNLNNLKIKLVRVGDKVTVDIVTV